MVTIHISTAEMDKIARWNKNNREIRDNIDLLFPYNDFIVDMCDDKFGRVVYEVSLIDNDIHNGYCKVTHYQDDMVQHTEFRMSEEALSEAYEQLSKPKTKQDLANMVKNSKAVAILDNVFIWGILAYIMHKSSKRKVIVKESLNKANNGVKSKHSDSDTKTYLLNDIIVYAGTHKPRHKIEYTCPSWGVRGHYRHYKNGKVVFIREYVKGAEKGATVNKDVFLHK